MDYSQFVQELSALIVAGAASTVIAIKVTQSVMEEKLKAMKFNQEEHRREMLEESGRIRSDVNEFMDNYNENHKERIDIAMDYIKRVEFNKADRSEVNLVIDATKRIEHKLDLLILKNNK